MIMSDDTDYFNQNDNFLKTLRLCSAENVAECVKVKVVFFSSLFAFFVASCKTLDFILTCMR